MQLSRITLALTLLLAAFSVAEEAKGDGPSSIEGVISVGPINPGPLANVAFVVTKDEQIVASFTTDELGRFKLSLPSGHYTASLKERNERAGQFGPFAVDVVGDTTTKVEWHCDNSTALKRGPADR
jgi:hypothetical protein